MALTVVVAVGTPATVAVNDCAPDTVPRVQLTLARPSVSVTALAAESVPPPVGVPKVTVTPNTPSPSEPFTCTVTGVASAPATVPV